jgi:hypothetical protein
MTTLLKRAGDAINNFTQTALVALCALIMISLVRVVFEFASRFHWSLGALLAIVIVSTAVLLTRHVKQAPKLSLSGVVAVLGFSVLTLAIVFAWISFALFQAHLATYEAPNPSTSGQFVDFYMYEFFDLIPSVKVWETLGVKSPIVARGFAAGLPLLAFKIFVLWVVFDAFASWKQKPAPKENRVSH